MNPAVIVERVKTPIVAWQYDGTGRQTWAEDRSTWPGPFQAERSQLRFSNGGHLFHHVGGDAGSRRLVNKGDWLVNDSGLIYHFETDEAFLAHYAPVNGWAGGPERKQL